MVPTQDAIGLQLGDVYALAAHAQAAGHSLWTALQQHETVAALSGDGRALVTEKAGRLRILGKTDAEIGVFQGKGAIDPATPIRWTLQLEN